MGKFITSTLIAAITFTGICMGRKTVVKSYFEKEGQSIIKSEIKHVGKNISINTLRKECRKFTQTRLKHSLRILSSSEKKQLVRMGNIIPFGNDGINSEKWTFRQIAKQPLYPKAIKNFKEFCTKEGISDEVMAKILNDFGKSRRIVLPANNRHVDFSGMAINICKLPSTDELISHLGGKDAIKGMSEKNLKENIREYHYQIAHNAFAKRYNVTPKQAERIFGLLDHAPHEAENGVMQLVPNSVHNFKQHYGHDGLVSKRVAEIKTLIINI